MESLIANEKLSTSVQLNCVRTACMLLARQGTVMLYFSDLIISTFIILVLNNHRDIYFYLIKYISFSTNANLLQARRYRLIRKGSTPSSLSRCQWQCWVMMTLCSPLPVHSILSCDATKWVSIIHSYLVVALFYVQWLDLCILWIFIREY